jgi:TonB family protein
MAGLFACAMFALAAASLDAAQSSEPVYPSAALRADLAGRVLLRLTLSPEGAVTAARVVQVDPPGHGFEDEAVRAARQLHFAPGSSSVDYEFRFEKGAVRQAVAKEFAEEIQVQGHYQNHVGSTEAASAGSVNRQLIEDRPLLRPGEIEELVPGLIVTQHSGAGKANQFFLRGFNLDHGTDFASSLDGVPLNLPSHAHGQGYADLNSVIPELIGHVDYFKGPYYAAKGDFASAGAADLFYVRSLPATLTFTGGSFGYYRAFAAASPEIFGGTLLAALEGLHEDGPWAHPDDYFKYNAVLRYTHALGDGLLSLMGQGYAGKWNATDQIAERAVPDIGRFGSLDPSDGGRSYRYTFSASWDQELAAGDLRATAYVSRYFLDLFSNFTYLLANPVDGDQMEQVEHRWYEGFNGRWRTQLDVGALELGWDGRVDHIAPLGLYRTAQRVRLPDQPSSVDSVTQSSGALYGSFQTRFTSWLRADAGLRATAYAFHVLSSDPRNTGDERAALLLPKASLVFGPWRKTEVFVNLGEDFHSNDARGVTATVATDSTPVGRVTPLARSIGYETGVRTEIVPDLQASIAFWLLDLDSEQVWNADAGTTEPSPATRRKGVEFSARWQPIRWLLFDLDLTYSQARFRDLQVDAAGNPLGQYVPEGIETSAAAGVSVHRLGPWSASLFMRWFGPRALTQDDVVRSTASLLFNAQASYRLTKNARFEAELFNLFDAQADDIAYYYASRLPGEPSAGVKDVHFHPAEPRGFRLGLTLSM